MLRSTTDRIAATVLSTTTVARPLSRTVAMTRHVPLAQRLEGSRITEVESAAEAMEVLAQGRIKDFGPLLLIWGGAMLVLLQTNDRGSALLQFGIFLAITAAKMLSDVLA